MTLISLEYYLEFKGNTEETIGELKMESFKESSGKDTERRDIGLCLTLKVIRLVKVGQGEKRQNSGSGLCWGNGDRGDKEEGGIK